MGVKVEELKQLMAGVTAERIQAITEAAMTWKTTASELRTVAQNMRTHKVNVTDSFGEQSKVTEAAHASFDEAHKHMLTKAGQLDQTASALTETAMVLTHARSTLDTWAARPTTPSETPADAAAAAKQDSIDETTAGNHIRAITSAYGDAITQMKTVDELPGQQPVSSNTGPSSPSYPTTGGSGGPGGSAGSSSSTSTTTSTTSTSGHGYTSPSQEPTHPTTGTDHTGAHPGTTTVAGTGTGSDGWFQGGPGTSSTYPTSQPHVPAASAGAVGTAGSGGSGGGLTAGVLGGAGAAGGLGSYGSAGVPSALRFSPGQTIGGTPGSAAAGVLGAEERAVAGQRSIVSAGGGAGGGAGGAGGRGSAGGAGGRGAAGRRGVGASGGRRDRRRDRDENAPEDMWDDGSDWIDDEATGPEVVR